MAEETEQSPLWRIVIEQGDADLFPVEVHQLYEQGRIPQARAALKQAAATEPDRERKARQLRYAADPYLWSEPLRSAPSLFTFNGIGTRLYGRRNPQPNGLYVSTLWFIVLFVPVYPLQSYVVADGEEGGWHFYAKAPLSATARGARWAAMAAVALAGLAVVGVQVHGFVTGLRFTDVAAYNGFDVPVQVTVAQRSVELPAHSGVLFREVPTEPTTFSAALADGGPLDSHHVDLSGHAWDMPLYNVHGRGLVAIDNIWYGGHRDPPEGELLPPDPVLFVHPVDYVFTEPPETKYLRGGAVEKNTYASGFETEVDSVAEQAVWVASSYGPEAAERMLLGEVAVRYDEDVALATWLTLDADGFARVVTEARARHPSNVDAHRMYQETMRRRDLDALTAEYVALLEENPGSPLYLYLHGRLMPDSAESEARFREVIALDPEFPYAWAALGSVLAEQDRFVQAADAYARFAGFGPDEASRVLPDRLLVARLSGDDPAPVLTSADPQTAGYYELLFRAEAGEPLDALHDQIDEDLESFRKTLRLELALAGGDVEQAVARKAELGDEAWDWAAPFFLLVALSDDAPDEMLDEVLAADPQAFGNAGLRVLAAAAAANTSKADLFRQDSETLTVEVGYDILDVDITDRAAVDALVGSVHPRDRGMLYAAAAVLAEDQRGSADWKHYRASARKFSLPGQLPCWD